MSKITHSFRSKLLLIYLVSIVLSAIVLTCFIAEYFSNVFLNQNISLTGNTLNAVSQNINTYLDDLNRISVLPYMDNELLDAFHTYANESGNADSYSLCQAERKIRASFQLSLDTNRKEVNSILIVYPDGEADYFNRYTELTVKTDYPFEEQPWYQSIRSAGGSAAFVDLHTEDYLETRAGGNVFSIGRLIKDPDTQKSLVVIVSNINTEAIDDILNASNFGTAAYILIQDNAGNLVYSPQSIETELQNEIFSCEGNALTYRGIQYAKLVKHVSNTDWNINVLMPYYQIDNDIAVTKITTGLLILFQIAFAFLLFYFWSRSITRRFSEIRTVMRTAKSGDFSARYRWNGNDEISLVGSDLNDMIATIRDLMEKERAAILKMKSAEYNALQAQINPHFIYNVLNGFVGLNRLGKRDLLEEAILSLSGMMRYILEHQEYTTLAEEIGLITQYCNLQKLRFGKRLRVTISLDESVRDFRIPKLLLQPLVENAILHGIEPLTRQGTLRVSAECEQLETGDFLVVTVLDDGVGFEVPAEDEKSGLGIRNVRERLALSFEHASLKIESHVGNGTKAEIRISTSHPALAGNGDLP